MNIQPHCGADPGLLQRPVRPARVPVADQTIEALHTAIRMLTRAQLNTSLAVERIRAEVPACAEFISSSRRGVIKG